jgi:hypothetical protein
MKELWIHFTLYDESDQWCKVRSGTTTNSVKDAKAVDEK